MLFSAVNAVALAGWSLLVATLFVRRLRPWGWALAGRWLPALFGLLYAALIAGSLGGEGGFGSLEAVRTLFADDHALLAGWLHYLAFDLFVGRWIAERGVTRGRSPWLLVPVLIATFVLGPVGLVLALLLGLAERRGEGR